MRAAVRLPNTNRVVGRRALARVCEAAEQLGFDAVSADDHLVFDGSWISSGSATAVGDADDRDKLELMTTLAFAAAWTERVRLLCGVVLVPVREPILLAKQTATLDFLSEGRLIMGAGIGGLIGAGDSGQDEFGRMRRLNRQREYEAFGLRGNRGPILEDHLRAVIAVWTQERASHRGPYAAFESLDCFPKPVQKPYPPIWIGGRSAHARERAAAIGDAWFPSQPSAAEYHSGVADFLARRAVHGREAPRDFPVNLFMCLGETDEAAWEMAEQTIGDQFQTREQFENRTLVGSAATITSRLRRFRDAGANFVELKPLYDSIDHLVAQMRVIADEVLPAVDSSPVDEVFSATPTAG